VSMNEKVVEVIRDIEEVVVINGLDLQAQEEVSAVKVCLNSGEFSEARSKLYAFRESGRISDLAQIELIDVEIKIYDLMLAKMKI
jgi:hypothetical protein